MRKRFGKWRVCLSLAVIVGAFSVTAPAAQATWHITEEWNYGGWLVNAGETYSPGWNEPGFLGNVVWYSGAGNVAVCQRTFDHTSGVYREGCGTNSVGNSLNLTPYYGHYLEPKLKNASGSAHTIWARAYAGWWG